MNTLEETQVKLNILLLCWQLCEHAGGDPGKTKHIAVVLTVVWTRCWRPGRRGLDRHLLQQFRVHLERPARPLPQWAHHGWGYHRRICHHGAAVAVLATGVQSPQQGHSQHQCWSGRSQALQTDIRYLYLWCQWWQQRLVMMLKLIGKPRLECVNGQHPPSKTPVALNTALDMLEWREITEQIDWWAKQPHKCLMSQKIWSVEKLETVLAGRQPRTSHHQSPGGEGCGKRKH